MLFSNKTPPFWRKIEGVDWAKTQITVPRVKQSKIEWETIRLAIDGANGFMVGPWKGKAELADDTGQLCDSITVSGDSEQSVTELIENIIFSLSDLEILRINCHKQTRSGSRGRVMYREPIRVYPGYCTVLNAQKILNEEEGRSELTGAYKRQSSKLDLWGEAAPPYWEAEVQDLLRSPGADV